jgi:Cupin-like domain
VKTAFPDTRAFTALYPEIPGKLRHNLADHPMFTLEALVALAGRIQTKDVEYNRGDLPRGIDFEDIPANGLSIADTIRGIEENGSWMVLKFVEQDAAYHDLLADTLAELDAETRAKTGAMLKREAFIFISSPNSVTPLHFDPEHNILLQLRGKKTMTIFPADDEEIASPLAHEQFYLGTGHRNLPWDDRYAPRGQRFDLSAGDGIYVPLMAPHWVQNGPDVSVSFSITWRSAHSYAEAEARGMNAILRRTGLNPETPKRYPARNLAKSTAFRAVRKVRHIFNRD